MIRISPVGSTWQAVARVVDRRLTYREHYRFEFGLFLNRDDITVDDLYYGLRASHEHPCESLYQDTDEV